MALLTLADMETEVWDNILDTDSLNRAIATAILDRLLNRCYALVRGIEDDRPYMVTANTSGCSFAPQAGAGYKLLTETNYRRILEVYPAASGASIYPLGPALARWEPWEMFAQQVEDPTDRAIYASAYAVWRAGTTTPASVGRWNIGMWPLSTVSYDYLLTVLKEVTALTATDKADATETEHHLIVDMASLVAGRWIGRPEEYLGDIRDRIPSEAQAAAKLIAADLGIARPRIPAEAA